MSDLSLILAVPASVCESAPRIRMAGTTDDPLWCLADLCKAFDVANSSDVSARLDPADKVEGVVLIDPLHGGGPQRCTCVKESGLYEVVLTARKAVAFRRWVTREVLPSIRKHGCYPPPAARKDAPPPLASTVEDWLVASARAIQEQRRDLDAVKGRVEVIEAERAGAAAAQKEARRNLSYKPASPARETTARAAVRLLVETEACGEGGPFYDANTGKGSFGRAYRYVIHLLNNSEHINIFTSKREDEGLLDCVDRLGWMDRLQAIAYAEFVQGPPCRSSGD